jgi:pyruvate formate lyase activating enzyme
MDTLKRMCEWLVKNDLHHFPLHFSAFSPMHKLTHLPATPLSALKNAYKIAKDYGIKYVYIGNVSCNKEENTYCPKCAELLIERNGYNILKNNIVMKKCPFCGELIDGVWGA